jgi:hypothetical protein
VDRGVTAPESELSPDPRADRDAATARRRGAPGGAQRGSPPADGAPQPHLRSWPGSTISRPPGRITSVSRPWRRAELRMAACPRLAR